MGNTRTDAQLMNDYAAFVHELGITAAKESVNTLLEAAERGGLSLKELCTEVVQGLGLSLGIPVNSYGRPVLSGTVVLLRKRVGWAIRVVARREEYTYESWCTSGCHTQ